MNPFISTGFDPHRGMTALSVNVNKVALLRNTRELGIPSVLRAATFALEAGAQGITVHPRPDERHIRRHDVYELAELMRQWPQAEYNIEGNPFHNLMAFVRDLVAQGLPCHQVTFVPDSAEQSTSDHGWLFPQDAQRLAPLIAEARDLGVRVSLFMDPLPAHAALKEGLGINAGHDLNRDNLTEFLRAVPGVQEVSIGHALIADALELGYSETVRDYLRCIHDASLPA
jgi:pyridoxine 5-phosphate synthase